MLYVRVDSRHVSSATLEEGRCVRKVILQNNNAEDVESAGSVRACVCVLYFTTALSVSKTYAVLTHGPTSIANWARNSFESFTCSFFKAGHASNRRHDDCYRFHHKMM